MVAARPHRVCLVTGELYPFTPGGIGRLVHNLLVDALQRGADVELHLLVPNGSAIQAEQVRTAYAGRVIFHRAPSVDSPESRERWGGAYPERWGFTDTPAHVDSLELMLALKLLESSGLEFDVVEFPDYLGWAHCALQERKLGLGLARAVVAVRLHSTAGIIQEHEGANPSIEDLGTFELERRALEEADLVVSHLPGLVDLNARFYGFRDAWKERVVVQFPPIPEAPPLDVGPLLPRGGANADLAFVTKVQGCKRPDLFVRAAVAYMRRVPAYTGRALLACHAPDPRLLESLLRVVPPELKDRVTWVGPATRELLLRTAVVVIPSDFESLNLAAYEAAQLRANLVLNATCPAFGQGSPFVDGQSCWTFDGTVEGLTDALGRALQNGAPGQASWSSDEPYFLRPVAVRARPVVKVVGGTRVSVLVTNYNLAAYLGRCLQSVAASTHDNVEVVVVDDASTQPLDHEVLARLERLSEGLPVKLVRNEVNRGLSASRNIGLSHCSGDFVLPLDADDLISPRFLEVGVRALQHNPDVGVVVPNTGYFDSDEDAERRKFADYAVFLGNVPTLGMFANRLSSATSLIRRELVAEYRYDERMDSYEDWSLYLRMAHAGVRFLVTNDICFFYRRREGSMARSIAPERKQRLKARMYATLPRARDGMVHLAALGLKVPGEAARPLRHRLLDRAYLALGKSLPPAPPGERPLRYEVVDRLHEALKKLAKT